jgi:deoxyribonuclease-4
VVIGKIMVIVMDCAVTKRWPASAFSGGVMLKIGCHLSSSKGYLAMGKEAVSIGANTFQFFTRNPRGSAAKPLDKADVADYLAFAREHRLYSILAHAPYTLNSCAADEGLRTFARETMADDLFRLEHVPGSLYNFHPGSHVKQGVEQGVRYISETLNQVLKPRQSTVVLLETMAGKGSEVGCTFEELRAIIDRVEQEKHLGVCLDTCHVFDGGYDIVDNLDDVLEKFDGIIGLDRLRAVHLNDSRNGLGSHKDRHEKIGEGNIGMDAFAQIINHPALRNLPFYLETPNDVQRYAQEIALLKKLYRGNYYT